MEAALERCEAYKPQSDPLKDERYAKVGNTSLLGGFMLRQMETRESQHDRLKEHLEAVQHGMNYRELVLHALPREDTAETSRPDRHFEYQSLKAQRANPTVSTRQDNVKRTLREYGA